MSTGDPRFIIPPIMSNSRWGALDGAIDVFIGALNSTPYTEHVGLVSFGSSGTWAGVFNTVSDIDQPLTENTSLIGTAMDRISSRVFNGMTTTSAGIDNGVAVLTSSLARPFAGKTIVLLTDGFPTAGRSPVLAAQDAAGREIVVHVVTFGAAGLDSAAMRDVATAGNGRYYHAPDPTTLNQAFREIALSLPVVLTE
jgi:Ca-activated chloride channel homolog